MPRQTIIINNIWGGIAASDNFLSEGQYSYGIGIDPEAPISDASGDKRSSGVIRPTAYEDFSGANVTDTPLWFTTTPKDTKLYAYLANGRLISYSSALGSETLVGTATSSSGNGFAYYNNYLYMATNTNVSRYGPLNGSASLTNSVWTGSTLGSQTALTDTTYPTIRSEEMPNHIMHVHGDNKLYFGDFKDGQGMIHYIKTKKTTDEGDTNDGSTYNALDLPFGFMPVAIASFGTDLAIAAIQTSDSTLKQGGAKLFLWDTFSDSFYADIDLVDSLVTAMKSINGILYIWSGPVSTGSAESNGYRISIYQGGTAAQQVHYSDSGSCPLPGAVAGVGQRLMWGTFTQLPTTTPGTPNYYPVVMAIGARDSRLPTGIHCIAHATAAGTASDGTVTALINAEQDSFSYPKLILGHRDAGGAGIDKQSTTYRESIFRYPVYVGSRYAIKRIRIPLFNAIDANTTITPVIFTDSYSGSSANDLDTINSTNYPNSEKYLNWFPDINGEHDFTLQLNFSGTGLDPVLLPIRIDVEVYED